MGPLPQHDPLSEIAVWASVPKTPVQSAAPITLADFDLGNFIAAHLNVRRGPLPWDGRGEKWELEVCPFNTDHTGGCAVVTRGHDGTIGFKCHHNGCADKHWRDLRVRFEGSRSVAAQMNPSMSRLRVEDLPNIWDLDAPDVRYMIEPELPEGAVVAITGDSGCGKSTLVSHWAGVAMNAGRSVLVLDRENPVSMVRDRLMRLGISRNELLFYWGGWLGEEAPQPSDAVVLAWVGKCSPKPLVIVDSLVAFQPGNENDAVETRRWMHQCRRVANTGATVAVIHHSGRSESNQDYRGSSDFKAAIDQGFVVTNLGTPGRLGTLKLRCFKSRLGFAGEVVYQCTGGRLSRVQNRGGNDESRFRELLRAHPGITTSEFERLATEGKLGRNLARNWLTEQFNLGAVNRESVGKNGFRYFLTRGGEQGN
jgi:hypothetical protein